MANQKSSLMLIGHMLLAVILYLISVPGLVMSVLIRYKIGTDRFASWSWKPHGQEEGQRAPHFITPFWTLLLAYLWVRTFMVINVALYSKWFNADFVGEWIGLLPLYLPWETGGPQIWSVGFGSNFFWWFSIVVVFAGLLQLILFEYAPDREDKVDVESLGRSIPFFWLIKPKTKNGSVRRKNLIRVVLDPALITSVGVLLYVLDFPVHAWFFWIGAISILFTSGFQAAYRYDVERGVDVDIESKNKTKTVVNLSSKVSPPTAR